MQIVIDIPEEVLNRICFGVTYPTDMVVACNAIHEHIKLPKGHGDLKDVGKIVLDKFIDTEVYSRSSRFSSDYKKGYNGAIDDVVRVLVNAATIVEADKEDGNDSRD